MFLKRGVLRKFFPTKMAQSITGNGGVYVPPFKLARLKEEITDQNSAEAQRFQWENLRKSIKGLVNRVSSSNIKECVQELFVENLVRGRGLFVRSVLQAQMASPVFTNVFAALIAVVNSKLPDVGDLLLRRIVLQLRRAYVRNDELMLTSQCQFLAHLFNQRVVSEMVIFQVVTIFLEKLSNDSVKLCCTILLECGEVLSKVSSKGMFLIFERLRSILQEGEIDKRVQYMVEALFEARRKKFVGHPGVTPELDLVEDTDHITHEVDVIEGEVKGEENLNVFQPADPEVYAEQCAEWKALSEEILGGEEEGEEGSSSSDESVEEEKIDVKSTQVLPPVKISDMTDQDLINLRRTIYLAIMSSANYEECVHKILSLRLRDGQEREVCQMLIDCCAMEKTSNKFFSFQAERLARLSRNYKNIFEECFAEQYEAMHQYETGKIRNLAKFYSYLLVTDAIRWEVLQHIRLTEEDTTSSTRIFLKILFQDLNENLGIAALAQRVNDPQFSQALAGVFPLDSVQAIRFSINFFTAIGLGPLTTELRNRLNEIQVRIAMQEQEYKQQQQIKQDEDDRSPSRKRRYR